MMDESQAGTPAGPTMPWEYRRDLGVNRAFFATLRLIMRSNGCLRPYLDGTVDNRSARSFRSLVMNYAVLTVSMLLLAGGGVYLSRNVEGANRPVIVILATLGVVAVLVAAAWLMIRLYLGVVKWFFISPGLTDDQQENAISLVQYLSVPWALLPVVALPLLLLFGEGQMVRNGMVSAIILAVAFSAYWFQLILSAMRSLTGLGWRRVVLRGLGLLAVWAALTAGAVLVPLSVPMWLLMYASMQ